MMDEESIRFGQPEETDNNDIDESIHVTSGHIGNRYTSRLLAATSVHSNKSVTFRNDDDDSDDDDDNTDSFPVNGREIVSANRVSSLKAKLRNSFHGDASFQKSWGGARFNLSAAVNAMSGNNNNDSSSSSEDSFGGDVGDMPGMDNSDNFRSRARRDDSISFNMSFMNVNSDPAAAVNNNYQQMGSMDESGKRKKQNRRATARGSLFVIADEKFANTRVVQARLERAAKKLQRFLRQSLLVTRRYNKERIYLQGELEDAEHRRLEELADYKNWIQEEQEQFRLEFEQECNNNDGSDDDGQMTTMDQGDWDNYQIEQDDLRQQVKALKAENKIIKKEGRALIHVNDQLETGDPEREAEGARLEKEVTKLTTDIEDWKGMQLQYHIAIEKANTKIDSLAEKRKAKRADRKKIEKVIRKIVALLEQGQGDETPKLLEKVLKLKTKREKKIALLKQQTVEGLLIIPLELEGVEDNSTESATEIAEAAPEQQQQRKSRKIKKLQVGDLPELEKLKERTKAALKSREEESPVEATPTPMPTEEAESPRRKQRKSKKVQAKDLPELAQIDTEIDTDTTDQKVETPVKKKDKKQKKRMKDAVSLVMKQREKEEGDATLMMVYAAEKKKKKKAAAADGSNKGLVLGEANGTQFASALMSLMTSS